MDFVGQTITDMSSGFPRNETTVWLNDGRGTFSRQERLRNSFGTSFAVGDVDGDGDLDVVDGSVHFNDGRGSFSSSGNLAGSSSAFTVRGCALADLDNDADLDVLVSEDTFGVSWFRNDGTGSFSTKLFLGSSSAVEFPLQDLDGDGDLDMLWGSSVMANDGQGNFTKGPGFAFNSPFEANSEPIGDIDGDGDIDALTASGRMELRLYTNNGRGMFSEAAPLFSTILGLSANLTASGDLDNDGDLDLVVLYRESQGVSGWRVFLNRNALPVASATTAQQLSVWPVPAAAGAVLQVRVPGHTGAAVATLHTLTGQVVRSVPFSGAALALPTAGLPAGSYLLSLEGAAPGRLVRRVVLE
ncbi:FG-GAP-like repeat-containing protein [Hymenobacter sp. APR13]|uniref:FG-GAP-like repeat-containing protein n=1 Tax=Hymenobacter sp. APR13 TaxID=1356852 RepID=UPI0004E03882|nr:FG-GAP-like repeat-containing protein [Hymenobacter sp. APR13]AII51177.1 hypothetical protein N008_04175 [Hymenobacter sp. APR13]